MQAYSWIYIFNNHEKKRTTMVTVNTYCINKMEWTETKDVVQNEKMFLDWKAINNKWEFRLDALSRNLAGKHLYQLNKENHEDYNNYKTTYAITRRNDQYRCI